MSPVVYGFLVVVVGLGWGDVADARETIPSDDNIRSRIIEDSIRTYAGNCPCPFNTMRNGRRCGGNSAYSRPGGQRPLCFADDVSAAMIDRYRKTHSQPTLR